MSKVYCRPMSLSKLIRHMQHPERRGKIAVVIGTITDDVRIYKIPKLTVCNSGFPVSWFLSVEYDAESCNNHSLWY